MKRKRYASGGMTQADIDAGLTQADVDAGLRGGKNERISDEDRQAALRSTGMAESFPVEEPKPQMRKGLSDQEAAKLMGREVRQPAPKRTMPDKNVPSPHDFEGPTPSFEANYPKGSRYHNEAFEDNYPGPRQVKVPTRKDYSGVPNAGKVGTATNKPFAEDVASSFTKRVGRAESNSPLSKDMVNNPAKARLMRAISAGSAKKYDQDARDQYATDMADERDAYAADVTRQRDAALVAQQLRSDFGPYKKGGVVKKMAKGGTVNVSSASRRGDGIAQRGKTKGRMV
jgi:hypothetical protein